MVFSGSSGKLNVKYSVFFGFRRYPTFAHSVSIYLVALTCACTIPSDIRAMSSAKSRSVSITGWTLGLSLGVIVHPSRNGLSQCIVKYYYEEVC